MDFQSLTIQGIHKRYAARWRLVGEVLDWEIEGKTFRINSAGDLAEQVETVLRTLSKSVFHDSLKLRACLTCQSFHMSSMARDMGRGQRGGCRLHAKIVEICFLCDDFSECCRAGACPAVAGPGSESISRPDHRRVARPSSAGCRRHKRLYPQLASK